MRGFALQSAVALALAFASIMILDWHRAARDLQSMESRIRAGLITKGQGLTGNLSLVIQFLAEDNAIASIREIVDSLADQDPNIAYAAYQDEERRPWAFRSKLPYGRTYDMRMSLSDSMSLWAAGAAGSQSRAWADGGGEIIEFASPVVSSSGILGVVRVGLDTRAMHAELASATAKVWQNRMLTLCAFLAAALCAFFLSFQLSRLQSSRLTRPVLDLAASARRIAAGDYTSEVGTGGDGELALLAETFEAMRRRIQAYMHKLESLVAEKVRQISDLLENVDQGLFTFNLDLTVNPDHSARASSVLRLESLPDKTLPSILRMTPSQAALFRDWTDLVRQEHAHRRWDKLAKLAPVREITLDPGADAHIIEIGYRKILDAEGRLVKIMVLAQDVTEKRVLERRLAEERVRHESKMKIILGVSGHAEEVVAGFLQDATRKLGAMAEAWNTGGPDWKRRVFFDCHTLKGVAGGFGFEALANAAHDLETRLQDLGDGVPDDAFREGFRASLRAMEEETAKIENVRAMLSGNQEQTRIRVHPEKVQTLRRLAEKAEELADPGSLRELAAACRTLGHSRLDILALKYRELVARAARNLGKEAELEVLTPEVELDPALIARVDDALVHIFRNALAHGIEDTETRTRLGKGKGRIEFSYSRGARGHAFVVRDDGKGIDCEALARRAVDLGLVTAREAAALGPEGKTQLIFKPGLSTAAEAGSLAGRGQGMAIVREMMKDAEGDVTVESWPGAGTRFTLHLPDPAHQQEPAERVAIRPAST